MQVPVALFEAFTEVELFRLRIVLSASTRLPAVIAAVTQQPEVTQMVLPTSAAVKVAVEQVMIGLVLVVPTLVPMQTCPSGMTP